MGERHWFRLGDDMPPYRSPNEREPTARAARFAAQKDELAAFLSARLAEAAETGFGPVDRAAIVALTTILRPHGPGRVDTEDGVTTVFCQGCEYAAYPCEDVRTALKVWEGHAEFRGYWLRLRTEK